MSHIIKRKRLRQQRLAARCYRKEIVVPSTVEVLKGELKQWIAGCVTSRTLDKTGKPMKREEILVDQSSSIQELWDDLKTHIGTTVEIGAEYTFRRSDDPVVEAVSFFWRNAQWDFEGDDIHSNPPRQATIDKVARRFIAAVKKHVSGERRARILCCLKQAIDASDFRDKWELKFVPHDYLKDDTRPITEENPVSLSDLESFVRDYGDYLYSWARLIEDTSDEVLARHIVYQVDEQLNQGLAVMIGWAAGDSKALLTRGHFFIREWVLKQSKNANSVYHCFR